MDQGGLESSSSPVQGDSLKPEEPKHDSTVGGHLTGSLSPDTVGGTPQHPNPSFWSLAISSLPEKDRQIFKVDTPLPDATAILNEIILALEKQRDRCKRDRWTTISVGGKELVIRDVCAKIVACIKKFMEVVDVAVSFDPVHAALPWAGVRFLLQLSFTGFEIFGAIVEGLEKATRLVARCGILEALIIRDGSGTTSAKISLEDEIKQLYSVVLQFICKAKDHYDGSRVKRLLNVTTRQSLQKLVKEMDAGEQRMLVLKGLVDSERMGTVHDNVSTMVFTITSTANDVQTLQRSMNKAFLSLGEPLVRVADEVSDLHDALKENERSELLQWISTVSGQQQYKAALAMILPGSGEWLLKDPRFRSWRDSSSSETFWLHGIPGCGKTKLAATVIQHLQLHSSTVSNPASIIRSFCSRNPAEPERSDSRDILRSLVKQVSLVEGESLIRRPAVEAYQKRREEAIHAGERPDLLTAEDCVELISEIGRTVPFTIVIDGVDECSSQQREILLGALGSIRQRCRDVVKAFISSRYEEDIAIYFRKGEILEITPRANDEDIKHFVKIQVESFMRKWSTMHNESTETLQKLEKEIEEALVTGAQGMFLWVSLQLESTRDNERIKDIDSIRQTLASLPPTLSKSYEAVYKRIQSLGEGPRRVAVDSLRWLLYAERKLSVSELLAAVGRSSRISSEISPKSIIDYCCNIIVLDNVTDTFRLAHLSLREFLETASGYSIFESSETIVQRCLGTYLWGDCNKDDLLDYATRYWPAHVEMLSASAHKSTTQRSVIEFLTEEEHFEDWLESLEARLLKDSPGWSDSLEIKLNACFSSPPSALFVISSFGLIEALESPKVIEALHVNQLNKHDTSGLYLAARWGHSEVVRKLLDLGSAADAPGYLYGNALNAASFGGHTEIVKILLDHGVSCSPTKGEFSSPLHAALATLNDHVAEVLIDGGYKLATQKQFYDTLETASFRGNIKMIERILRGEAGHFTPEVLPDPLQVALSCGKEREAKRLLKDCAGINEEKGYFGNALAAAIASRKLSLVRLVIDAGADLDLCGRFGFPLRAATIANHLEIARFLLEKGLDPNIKDEKLGDPLQAAASSGHVDMMLLLLANGASVDGAGGYFGNTLQAACFHGHEKAVRLLIQHGTAFSDGSGRYCNALRAAEFAGHERIVEVLLMAYPSLNQELTFPITSARNARRPLDYIPAIWSKIIGKLSSFPRKQKWKPRFQ